MSLLNQNSRKLPVPPVDPNYPTYRHHTDGRSLKVNSPAEEPTEEGWGNKMYPKADPPEPLSIEQELEDARARLESQTKKFDEAWKGLIEENDRLKAENAGLASRVKKSKTKPAAESAAE